MRNDGPTKPQTMMDRLSNVALTGGVSGGVLGAASSAMTHGNLKKLPMDALRAALLGGTTAAGAVGAGELLLGDPAEDETNVYTKRGGAGGATVGALAGLLGTIAMSGKLPLSKLGSVGKSVEKALDTKNPLLMKFKKALGSKDPSKKALAIGAGIGVPAVAGGYFGADEGMGLDVLNAEIEAARDRRRKEQMLAGQV